MKEILSALAERPMTPPVLARTIGVDPEVLGDMVTSLIAQDLVEEEGVKLAITDTGRRALSMATAAHALPQAGSLMELGDDVAEQQAPEAEALLQFMAEPVSATKIAEASGIDVRVVRSLLNELKSRRLAQKYGNGYWKAIPVLAAVEVVEDVIEVDVPAAFELAITGTVPTDIEAALANLSSALTKREINNLPTKLAVLERLSALLDPTIATVLTEIQNDLKVAA
ncbi:MAG TPA: hypothetical protein DCS87_11810 [Rheinheimera sp.]|nr:hypothetical protein [Rheinheimera sp.]